MPEPTAVQLRSLPIIAGAMAAGVAIANGVAIFVIRAGEAATPMAPPALKIGLIAAAAACIVLAPALDALVRKGGAPPASARGPAATYVAGKSVGLALREAGGLLGMVLGLLTGEILWPAVFGAVALITILMAWPRAEERRQIENETITPH